MSNSKIDEDWIEADITDNIETVDIISTDTSSAADLKNVINSTVDLAEAQIFGDDTLPISVDEIDSDNEVDGKELQDFKVKPIVLFTNSKGMAGEITPKSAIPKTTTPISPSTFPDGMTDSEIKSFIPSLREAEVSPNSTDVEVQTPPKSQPVQIGSHILSKLSELPPLSLEASDKEKLPIPRAVLSPSPSVVNVTDNVNQLLGNTLPVPPVIDVDNDTKKLVPVILLPSPSLPKLPIPVISPSSVKSPKSVKSPDTLAEFFRRPSISKLLQPFRGNGQSTDKVATIREISPPTVLRVVKVTHGNGNLGGEQPQMEDQTSTFEQLSRDLTARKTKVASEKKLSAHHPVSDECIEEIKPLLPKGKNNRSKVPSRGHHAKKP